MTITKTALAAAILALTAISAHAQQGPTRQIQVLPAPIKQAQAPALIAPAPAKVDGEAPAIEAPAADAAPAVDAAPVEAAPAPKVIVAAPKVEPKFVEPKFVEPKFAPPVRKVGYGYGYGKRHICH